ncbi:MULTISPECIES: hypothetical protein [Halomonadaceae]|uniref:hypothetical protein n=1 Tax=Halomonadaceae TaxID=28256 RepID=UPI00159792AC|nr:MULTISPECIES: hypothetical protein [Halomonas]QJQ95441.1 hypothetical protein HIO72_09245 [Halomonas sp. PA5]
MASIAMRVAQSAASAIQAENLPLQLQNCQQFIQAALLGRGVSSFEDMKRLGIPVVIDKGQENVASNAFSTWGRVLRDDIVSERADKALRRVYERSRKPLPDPVEFQFQKLRVAAIITEHIRQHGLFVYTQRLLFAPAFRSIGMGLLKEMKLPELPPSSASSAIACDLLPALPSHNLKEHLLFLGGQHMRGFGLPFGSFAKWVSENEPTLVEFPAPDLKPGRMARKDLFYEHPKHPKHPSAELGLGFFLAVTKNQIPENISIVTPLLQHRQAEGYPQQPWRAEFTSEGISKRFISAVERKRLEAALSNFGGQSARLKVCPSCSEIYSDDRNDLNLRCSCTH